jgi:hypothetical protein
MRAYVDSDILIWHLRGSDCAKRLLRRLAQQRSFELWTGAMQRAEVVFFVRPHEEELTLSMLSRLRTQPVTQEIVDRAAPHGALARARARTAHDVALRTWRQEGVE